MRRAVALLAGVLALGAARAEPDWIAPDPANTLVVETTKGRIVVAMRPEFAPLAVERVKTLAREGVYDGLLFHRVIDGFVDQTGNPNNKDGGTSARANLPPEFSFRLPPQARPVIVTYRSDGVEGFLGASPIAGVSAAEQGRDADPRFRAWGAYCAGTAGMGRQAGIDTANSEIFFMRAPARRLDHDYAVWGQVVQGLEVVRAINVGEPPKDPDRMLKVRVAADLPPAERPQVEVLNPHGALFRARLAAARARTGATFTVCDMAMSGRVAKSRDPKM
jgi:peptidylprolyl isomerase